MLPAWPLAPGPLPGWLDSLSTRSSKLAPCHTVGWAQVLLSQETRANTPGPLQAHRPPHWRHPDLPSSTKRSLLNTAPKAQMDSICGLGSALPLQLAGVPDLLLDRDLLHSIHNSLWYLPEESFPRAGKSLSCSLNGLSGDTGRE